MHTRTEQEQEKDIYKYWDNHRWKEEDIETFLGGNKTYISFGRWWLTLKNMLCKRYVNGESVDGDPSSTYSSWNTSSMPVHRSKFLCTIITAQTQTCTHAHTRTPHSTKNHSSRLFFVLFSVLILALVLSFFLCLCVYVCV